MSTIVLFISGVAAVLFFGRVPRWWFPKRKALDARGTLFGVKRRFLESNRSYALRILDVVREKWGEK